MLQLSREMTHYMVRKDWALMVTTEWAKTMKVLSNMLIQQVYNLDPESFPLDKPTEKSRRIKGRKTKTSESDLPVRSVSEEPSKAIGSSLVSPVSAPGDALLARVCTLSDHPIS